MLVQPDHADLSIRRQCELLGLTRSMLYYLPVGVSAEDQALMKEIDRLFTTWPFFGSRKILDELRKAGHVINRKKVAAAHAGDGASGDGARAAHEPAAPGPPDLPVSPREDRRCPAEPGLGDGHHVHPAGAGVVLPGRHHRLALAGDPVVAAVEHDDRGFLRRGARGGAAAPRHAGDVQQRPGRAVHEPRASPACSSARASPSAWTARVERPTTSSSSGSGGRSSTRTSTCTRTERSPRRRAGIGKWIRFYNVRRAHQALDYRTPMEVYRQKGRSVAQPERDRRVRLRSASLRSGGNDNDHDDALHDD